MNGLHFAQNAKVLPILAPQDIVATATSTEYVRLRDANWITFLVQFGNITTDSTDVVTVTVEASNVATSTDSEAAIAFNYRLSAAVATDTMGAITAATSSGVALTAATGDNKMLVIEVDPAAVPADSSITAPAYVRVHLAPVTTGACLVSAVAVIDGKYKGNSIPTST